MQSNHTFEYLLEPVPEFGGVEVVHQTKHGSWQTVIDDLLRRFTFDDCDLDDIVSELVLEENLPVSEEGLLFLHDVGRLDVCLIPFVGTNEGLLGVSARVSELV